MKNYTMQRRNVIVSLICMLMAMPNASNAISLIGARLGPMELTDCTLIAQDAWNFNERGAAGNARFYENKGWQGTETMQCNDTTNDPPCPTDLPTGGPSRNGSAYIHSYASGSFVGVGLTSADRTWMDYDTDNKLSVSFHFKASRAPLLSYGWNSSPVVRKTGEFFSGSDASAIHAERICMNVDTIIDLGGPDTGAVDCGATVSGTNDGLGATTGVLSMPIDIWQHVALVFDSEPAPNEDAGTYKVYLDGDLINTETGIDGVIPNTAAMWEIGIAANSFQFTEYEIDNLQIFKFALSEAQVLDLDCNVPD